MHAHQHRQDTDQQQVDGCGVGPTWQPATLTQHAIPVNERKFFDSGLVVSQSSAPLGQEVVSSHCSGLGVGGAGGEGGAGCGLGGLGPVFTGKDAFMAMPHCPGLAPAVPRLRTSLPQEKHRLCR